MAKRSFRVGLIDISDYDGAEAYGQALADQLPPNAIMLSYTNPRTSNRMAVFRFYFQVVHEKRPDVMTVDNPTVEELAFLVAIKRPLFMYVPFRPMEPYIGLVRDGVAFRVVSFSPSGSLTTTYENLDTSLELD